VAVAIMVNMAIKAPPIMPAMAPAIRKLRSRFWFLVVFIHILLERVLSVEPPAQSVLSEV